MGARRGPRMRGAVHPRFLALITLLGATAFALLAADAILAWYDARIAASSEMDPGLLRYHPKLGWTLTPNWQGRHRHRDFDVGYSIDADGFRRSAARVDQPLAPLARIAVLGDSFTFGLGVEDGETFVSVLGELDRNHEHLNFGVPGYSTDQELLLLESQVLTTAPRSVWLMFYLGNDILDNALDYPLQADQAKPLFELNSDGSLQLHNVPVPRELKPAPARLRSIEQIVFGEALEERRSALDRLRDSSHLLGRLLPAASVADPEALNATLNARLEAQQRLLNALLHTMAGELGARGIELVVVALPGQSLVEQPQSASGIFQLHVLGFLEGETARAGIPFATPLDALREECGAKQGCFHPNEGHYTAAAHRVIARWLLEKERAAPGRPL